MSSTLSRTLQRNDRYNRNLRRSNSLQNRIACINVGKNERLTSTLIGGVLAAYGLKRRGTIGALAAATGAKFLFRGVTGHCYGYGMMGLSTAEERVRGAAVEVNPDHAIVVREGIEIARPREELFAIWRDFSRLPQFMTHLERVDVLSDTESHWVTKGPVGTSVEWEAEIVDEKQNEWIAWQSIEPAEVPNNGTVMFRDAPSGDTEIFVTIEAEPPAGRLGNLVARMFGKSPQRQVKMALERFKQMAESDHDWDAAKAEANSASSPES